MQADSSPPGLVRGTIVDGLSDEIVREKKSVIVPENRPL
jgi:hypothetical protein